MPVDGRRPGAPSITTAPALAEQRGQAGPGGDRHDPAARRARSARSRGGLDLLGEVGDPDPVRAAGGDAGLDRSTDVVDVDVDVPQPLAADDDQGVAERRRGRPCRRSTAAGSSESRRYITSYDGPSLGQVVGRAARRGHRDAARAERVRAGDRAGGRSAPARPRRGPRRARGRRRRRRRPRAS